MINLLPPDTKKEILFARRNTHLIRFALAAGIGFLSVALFILAGLFLLRQETISYKETISLSEAQLKKQNEAATLARVKELSNSLELVVQVLGQEVMFSELLRQTGAVMPAGTVLMDLSMDGDLTGALDLKAGVADNTAASQVLINLQDKNNRLFDKTDLVSIDCSQDRDPRYPCTATLKARFSAENAFMLLSNKRGGTE